MRNLLLGIFLLVVGMAQGAVLYVDVASSNPVPPYGDWNTAAADVQTAVDASVPGDLILVTNGIYDTGGRTSAGYALTNRVVVDKAVTLQSINGPTVTVIKGYQLPGVTNGDDAVRCVYLANNAALIGFTLTSGATRDIYGSVNDRSGGGVWCESSNVVISNCVVSSNACSSLGAGVYSGTLDNCQMINNNNFFISAGVGGGGGLAYSTIFNSTISNNSQGTWGGGAYNCTLSNCIVNGNHGGGVYACNLNNCNLSGNIGSSSSVSGGGATRSSLSNCVIFNNQSQNGGGAYACDLNFCTVSNNWASQSGGGVYAIANPTNRCGLNNNIFGNVAGSYGGGVYFAAAQFTSTNWNFNGWMFTSNSAVRDGGGLYESQSTPILNNCLFMGNSSGGNGGGFNGINAQNLTTVSNCTFNCNKAVGDGGGAYLASLINCSIEWNQGRNGGGVYGNIKNCVLNNNVAATNGGGVFVVIPFGPIFICNDNYFTNNSALNGGGAYGGNFSNCVFSANSARTNGGSIFSQSSSLWNCIVISNQAVFGGGGYNVKFQNCTISRNQATFGGGGYGGSFSGCSIVENRASDTGGGIYYNLPFSDPILATNCSIENNHADVNAGGAYGGPYGGNLIKCKLTGNSAGADGGGAYNANATSCIISDNLAGGNGGGTYNRALVNCLLVNNVAVYGGGSYGGNCMNSTVVNNKATVLGGGVYGGGATSCIIYENVAPSAVNWGGVNVSFSYCCTIPLPPGNNNFTNDPVFVNLAADNYRLQTNSPCINLGVGSSGISSDLDGRPRVAGGRIDIGAYEFQGPGMGEFTDWLQQYALPTNGSADSKDSDGDGLNNFQEWTSGTNPTNALSVLQLLLPVYTNSPPALVVTWQSVTNVTYYLQRSTNLPVFVSIQSNLVGQAGSTSYTDTSATNGSSFFYRVGVQ